MFSLFVLNLTPEGPSQQERLVIVLSGACCLLCWTEVACSEQYQTCQAVTFCLHTLTLALASWLGQAGVLSLLEVAQQSADNFVYISILSDWRSVWAPPS